MVDAAASPGVQPAAQMTHIAAGLWLQSPAAVLFVHHQYYSKDDAVVLMRSDPQVAQVMIVIFHSGVVLWAALL